MITRRLVAWVFVVFHITFGEKLRILRELSRQTSAPEPDGDEGDEGDQAGGPRRRRLFQRRGRGAESVRFMFARALVVAVIEHPFVVLAFPLAVVFILIRPIFGEL